MTSIGRMLDDLARIRAEQALVDFLRESLMIEGILRDPTFEEIAATKRFLKRKSIDLAAVCKLQDVYAPATPLRVKDGQNVVVGRYVPPSGGPALGYALADLCQRIAESDDPWRMHIDFEKLHPFMDGNGRTGRAIWAWHMQRIGRNPFALPFLHSWYYQTLDNVDRGGE